MAVSTELIDSGKFPASNGHSVRTREEFEVSRGSENSGPVEGQIDFLTLQNLSVRANAVGHGGGDAAGAKSIQEFDCSTHDSHFPNAISQEGFEHAVATYGGVDGHARVATQESGSGVV